ncbi:hypothetical protein [Marinifilum caeruleilacunae]|jgi:hypothetical protein|uniref:Uncharacterized protein n=1 Tax=Marinifilum caeruleilacunae TaxID=2499076 RepID=A0ABX1WSD8_9BACT|nr:hypothetical protein [Marinifilum caeruleilacunae]NOU59024.1 hypothetical protein [Marinifilum caeruleilacunae]
MTLKELFDIAKTQLEELTDLQTPDFRLEQAELLKEEELWEIVVSYLVEDTNKNTIPSAALTSEHHFHRIFKKIRIDKDKNVVGFYMYDSRK